LSSLSDGPCRSHGPLYRSRCRQRKMPDRTTPQPGPLCPTPLHCTSAGRKQPASAQGYSLSSAWAGPVVSSVVSPSHLPLTYLIPFQTGLLLTLLSSSTISQSDPRPKVVPLGSSNTCSVPSGPDIIPSPRVINLLM